MPVPQEYDWDYDNDRLKLIDGKPQIVTGAEAIKVWIWNALQTDRYKYKGYSWNYGHELKSLFGLGFTQDVGAAEAQRYITECLQVNPYIQNLTNWNITFTGDTISAEFTAITPYGEVNMSV